MREIETPYCSYNPSRLVRLYVVLIRMLNRWDAENRCPFLIIMAHSVYFDNNFDQ
jgi:hypothetical protein